MAKEQTGGIKAASITAAARNLAEFEKIGNRDDLGTGATSTGGRQPTPGALQDMEAVARKVAAISTAGIDSGQGVKDFIALKAKTDRTAAEEITVLVPKTFRLTLDNGVTMKMEQGVRPYARCIVEHKWCEMNGVRDFDPVAEQIKAFMAALPADVAGGKYEDPDYPIRMMKKRFGDRFTPDMEKAVQAMFPVKGEEVDKG